MQRHIRPVFISAGAAAAAILAAFLLGLSGCGRQEEPTVDYLKIGYVKYDANDTYINELTDDFREDISRMQTRTLDISVDVKDASQSQRTQNQRVEELLDGGVDVLCVNLVDRTAPSKIIDLAEARNVPVIFFNREPVREDLMQWDGLYYVGSHAAQSGALQGDLAAKTIKANPQIDRNGDGIIQYALLEGEPDHQDAVIRTEKSVSTIRANNIRLEKLSYQIANWSRAQAQTRMSQLISQYGNRIELVLCNNDDMALGAIDAYDLANVTVSDRPAVFGVDGTQAGLQAVSDGKMTGTVYHDAPGEALAIAELALALHEGTPSALSELPLQDGKYYYLPYTTINEDNIGKYLHQKE